MLRGMIPLLTVAFAAQPAMAGTYDALFTFGDSLVDSGNVQLAALGAGAADPTPAASGYNQGRFSNGFNAADYLSLGLFGHVTQGSLLGGTDFAFGGARATTNADGIPDLALQTGLFALATSGHADPNALYFINAGGNDGFAQVFGKADAPTAAQTGAAVAATVETLAALGARHFLVDNVFDLGNTPIVRAAGLSVAGRADTRAINAAIARSLDGLALPAGADLHMFNAFALGERVTTDPASFGLAGYNQIVPCLYVAGAAPVCAGYTSFDAVHPTDRVYQIFGHALVQTVPEPGSFALFGLGLCAALAWRRRARD